MVLKVTHLKKTGGSVTQYLQTGLDQPNESESAAQYFSNAQQAPTFWMGSLADEFGLSEKAVEADLLASMLDGTLPDGEQIKQHPNRRLGEDFTFNAPKSVSIASLAWGDDRIIAAHDEAVKEALQFVQREMLYARHGKNGVDTEYNPSVAIAIHRHIDSRPVTAPDGRVFVAPSLHSHCVIPNIVRRDDGTLGGFKVDFGEAQGLRLKADALYQSALAERLRALGIGLRESKNGFELCDIDDQMIEVWSPRKNQIDNALLEQGLTRSNSSHNQRQTANLATRERKGQYSAGELRKLWSTAPRPTGYTPPQPQPHNAPDIAVKNCLDDMSERLAVIPKALMEAQSIFSGCAHSTAPQIQQALLRNEELINLGAGEHVTTTTAVKDETYIKMTVQDSPTMPSIMDSQNMDSWINYREQNQGFRFSDDQRRALDFLLQSNDRVSLAVGAAGSGKTTLMSALTQATANTYEIIGLAPSHNASGALREAVGKSQTLASWIANPPKSGGRARFIILDESGMTSTHDFAALLRSLNPEDRLLCVGDPRQLSPVAAGQPFAQLLRENPHATLSQIRRQNDEAQRSMVSDFAQGNAKSGAEKLMQFVEETDDYQSSLEQIASAYLDVQTGGGSVVALASQRKSVFDLSLAIRTKMQESGLLTQNLGAIQTFEKVTMTRASMRRQSSYTKGTKLKNPTGKIFTLEAAPFMMNGQPTVTVTNDAGKRQVLTLDDLTDENWQIVSLQSLPITNNDQLLITDTVHALADDGKHVTLRNGQSVTLINFSSDVITAQLPNGETVTLDTQSPLPIMYGWARTVHKSQGQTVDYVLVLDDEMAGAQIGYVAASRQKKSIQVFSQNPEELQSRISGWATRASALDYKPSTLKDQQRYENAIKYALLEAQQTQHTAASQQPEPHHFQGMRP